jgi:hypothetical protein
LFDEQPSARPDTNYDYGEIDESIISGVGPYTETRPIDKLYVLDEHSSS